MNTPTTEPSTQPATSPRWWTLARHALVAGALAAAATTVTAAIAQAGGVALTVDAEQIPIPAFAFWSVVAALVGAGIAKLARTRRRFLIMAGTGTALSLIPPLAVPDDTATKTLLIVTHLIAAAIIVPGISRNLRTP